MPDPRRVGHCVKSVLIIAGMCVAVLVAILVVSAIFNANQDPPVCGQLAEAQDVGAIGQVVDDVAPGHDYFANELRAENDVRESCPEHLWKLDRYREQVLNPVAGG